MSADLNPDVTLLTEHLSYRPAVRSIPHKPALNPIHQLTTNPPTQALIDDIVNSINILSFRAIDAVENFLINAPPQTLGLKRPSPSSAAESLKHEIENGVHQLETLLEAKIDKNFDKMELYALRNVLFVPPDVRDWVRLSHHEGMSFAETERENGDGATGESVRVQVKKLRETVKLQAVLRREVERNEATIEALRPLLGKSSGTITKKEDEEREVVDPAFGFLLDRGELAGPITTTAEFTVSQLPALKALLADLGPRVEGLVGGGGDGGALVGEEEKSWRRERVEFVEREARRHLESVRGLELGEMGEVRDGEWQGEGRKLGKQEVEDLERVVGIVAGEDAGEPMDEGS